MSDKVWKIPSTRFMGSTVPQEPYSTRIPAAIEKAEKLIERERGKMRESPVEAPDGITELGLHSVALAAALWGYERQSQLAVQALSIGTYEIDPSLIAFTEEVEQL